MRRIANNMIVGGVAAAAGSLMFFDAIAGVGLAIAALGLGVKFGIEDAERN